MLGFFDKDGIYTGPTYSTDNGDLFDLCKGTSTIKDVLEQLLALYNGSTTTSGVSSQSGNLGVSSLDECGGYLIDKLTATDNSMSISPVETTDADGNTCITLDFSTDLPNIVLAARDSVSQILLSGTGNVFNYTLTGGTLVNVGDEVLIELEIIHQNSSSHSLKWYIDSYVPLSYTIPANSTGTRSEAHKLRIIRISDTAYSFNVEVRQSNLSISSGSLVSAVCTNILCGASMVTGQPGFISDKTIRLEESDNTSSIVTINYSVKRFKASV